MSEKIKWKWINTGTIQYTFLFNDQREEFVALLNSLVDENEQLRQQNDLMSDFRGFITEDIQKMKEENELLKEKLTDILELTEQTGMISLRKEQIRQIIQGD